MPLFDETKPDAYYARIYSRIGFILLIPVTLLVGLHSAWWWDWKWPLEAVLYTTNSSMFGPPLFILLTLGGPLSAIYLGITCIRLKSRLVGWMLVILSPLLLLMVMVTRVR